MFFNLHKAGKILPALLLLVAIPLFSQTQETDEDDFFFEEEEGITVVGTAETSQQIAVIDREEIERRAAPDLPTLLQDVLDMGITSYGAYGNQTDINMRGFDSERIAFLIDGVPVNSPQDGEFDLYQIDPGMIERIEVIYGGSDSKYNVSGALGGVINIVTIKKQKPGLRLGGSVLNTSVLPGEYRDRDGTTHSPHWEDLLDAQKYNLSAAWGGETVSIAANAFANRAANHFLFKDYVNKTRRKDNNEVWDAGAGASLVWELADLTKLLVSSQYYYGDKHIPSSGFSRFFGIQRDSSSRNNIMLDMPRAFHDTLSTEASLAWHFTRRAFESSAGEESLHDQHSLTAINRWGWFPGERLTLRAGIDYRFIHLDSTDMGIRLRHDGGVYLTAEYKPLEQLLVIPSVKTVFVSEGGAQTTAVPKLGLVWNVTDSFTLKNNYFRSFKFPDFEDLYWTGGGGFGTPDLRPEDGWGGDLGVVWRITERLKIESVFFTQWTADSIHWSDSSGAWRPENVGEAMFFGLDSKLRFEIPVSIGPIKKIIPSVSYQYMLSYLLSYGYTWDSEKRIPYMPAHTIGGSLDIPWETGSLLVSAHYESLRYSDTGNYSKLKPHFLLNATINQKIGKNYTVFGVVRNMLNQSYESFKDYPMPGLAITLGMKLNVEVPSPTAKEHP